MPETFYLIGLALITLIALVTSAFLCYKEKEGWGWFLFAAVVAIVSSVEILKNIGK